MYEVKINGKSLLKMENMLANQFEAVKVYAGNPWHPALDGKIKNVKVKTADDKICIK